MEKIIFQHIWRLLITLIITISCNDPKATDAHPAHSPVADQDENIVALTDEQLRNAALEFGTPEQHPISSILLVNGQIDVPTQNKISVSVPLGGYLRTSKLLPGMHVFKGQVLAVMQDQQYIQLQQDYLTAKSEFSYDESEFKRQSELNASKATSDKVYERTRADYETRRILIKSLEEKLRLLGLNPLHVTPEKISRSINIYSPINGFVTEVNVNPGKYVTPAEVMFELVDPSDIHLAVTVFEKDLDKLAIGQKLVASTNAAPELKYNCEIALISKNVSKERSAEVHCHFKRYDDKLVPGMFMNAAISVKKTDSEALPSDAIVNYENKKYIFRVKDKNHFEIMEVNTGESEKDFTEVFLDKDLQKEQFVIKGAYNLLMKMKNTSDE